MQKLLELFNLGLQAWKLHIYKQELMPNNTVYVHIFK